GWPTRCRGADSPFHPICRETAYSSRSDKSRDQQGPLTRPAYRSWGCLLHISSLPLLSGHPYSSTHRLESAFDYMAAASRKRASSADSGPRLNKYWATAIASQVPASCSEVPRVSTISPRAACPRTESDYPSAREAGSRRVARPGPKDETGRAIRH